MSIAWRGPTPGAWPPRRLAPGDFKVVRDRYTFYPKEEINHQALIEALESEADLKNIHNYEKPIGF